MAPRRATSDTMLSRQKEPMADTNKRTFAETVFDRNKRREAEINDALRQENARREAAVKNMHRLRALRQERDQKIERK